MPFDKQNTRTRGNGISEDVITLTKDEKMSLARDRVRGVTRGIALLSGLTCDWEKLTSDSLTKGCSAVQTAVAQTKNFNGGNKDSVDWSKFGKSTGSFAYDKVAKYIGKIWDYVRAKIEQNDWLKRLCRLLNVGLNVALGYLKKALLSPEVMKQLVPFYGPLKSTIDAVNEAINVKGMVDSLARMSTAAADIAMGIPATAMGAFQKYARAETIRATGKAAYNFAKSIGMALLQAFTVGAASIATFTATVVETVMGIAYNFTQAFLFRKATDRCRGMVAGKVRPSTETFKLACAAAPFAGAVFLGAAHYIGSPNVAAAFSSSQKVLSSGMVQSAITSVSDVQKSAAKFVAASHFPITFHDAKAKEKFGWVMDMIKGSADSSPKSHIITQKAGLLDKIAAKMREAWAKNPL